MSRIDHKPLAFTLAKATKPFSGRQLSAISEFPADIHHVSVENNLVANCLSRLLISAMHLGNYYAGMTADQIANSDLKTLRTAKTGLQLEDTAVSSSSIAILALMLGWGRGGWTMVESHIGSHIRLWKELGVFLFAPCVGIPSTETLCSVCLFCPSQFPPKIK